MIYHSTRVIRNIIDFDPMVYQSALLASSAPVASELLKTEKESKKLKAEERIPGWKELISFDGPVDFVTGVYDGLQMQKNDPIHVCE